MKYLSGYPGGAYHIARNLELPANDVLYCEGDSNYTRIYLRSGRFVMLALTLTIVENRIGSESFVRINRKYLVNRKHIAEIGENYVVMSNKMTLPIARRRKGVL
jgi:DNA-binding LytR/AlgR family response regulator